MVKHKSVPQMIVKLVFGSANFVSCILFFRMLLKVRETVASFVQQPPTSGTTKQTNGANVSEYISCLKNKVGINENLKTRKFEVIIIIGNYDENLQSAFQNNEINILSDNKFIKKGSHPNLFCPVYSSFV